MNFTVHPAKSNQVIGVLSIPHSGEVIPEAFLPYLTQDLAARREDLDYQVHELIDIEALCLAGITVIQSHIHRVCVDLNRSPQESVLFWKENTQGAKLVSKNPDAEQIDAWIKEFHSPYFKALKSIIADIQDRRAGLISVIDLHSMPSKPTDYHLKRNPLQKNERPDFCLSDRQGKTCSPEFITTFSSLLQNNYRVGINDPYIGGYITEFVDGFRTNNIQIEINRAIYMDEKFKTLLPKRVNALKPFLTQVLIEGFGLFQLPS